MVAPQWGQERVARSPRRLASGLVAATAVAATVGLVPRPAAATSHTLTFTPSADAYVSSAYPTKSYGTSSTVQVDADPTKQSFLRFSVTGVNGRAVEGVRLRMRQVDASAAGGRVHAMSSTSWSESVTWATRPTIDGPHLASFGSVSAGNWYEVPLGKVVTGDGVISLAMDSPSGDGADWSSRETSTPPQLLVDLAPPASTVVDGLSEVGAGLGSSDPTFYATNRRLALTAAGRLLAIHGRHAEGVQLAWREPAGSWQVATQGAVTDGLLLGGTGTGDWPTSLAITPDQAGKEHAWVVWSGTAGSGETARPVQMRHLTDLDSPGGPTVGPIVTVAEPGLGNGRVDLAFERDAGGAYRGAVTWVRRTGDTATELVVTWFTDVAADVPPLTAPVVLQTSTGPRVATLAPAPSGMRLLARGPSGKLRTYSHEATAPLTSWAAGPDGLYVSSSARPSAVVLSSGETLAVAESDTANHVVSVQRFSPAGVPSAVELQLAGYAQPTVATNGTSAWLVMVRLSDGLVVSRQLGAGWSAADRVEVGPEGGGNHAWPNALRQTDGRLRLVVRGPSGSSANHSAVLAFQRLL